jgi:hypothetical protein
MYVLQKLAVLDKLERRIRTAAIICHYSVNNVTIHTTAAIIDHYSVNNVTIDLSIHTKTKPGKPLKPASKHEKNEWVFCVWLDDEAQKGLSISADVVMEDAIKLYNQPKSMVVRRNADSTPAHF